MKTGNLLRLSRSDLRNNFLDINKFNNALCGHFMMDKYLNNK